MLQESDHPVPMLPQTMTPSPGLPEAPHTANPYVQAASSDNTRKAYQADVNHFTRWGGLLPTSPAVIVRYLQAFAATLNPRTLVRRLTALKHWHVYRGFADPTAYPVVRKTLTGILHVHGQPKNKAPALTLDQLTQMVVLMSQQDTLAMWRNNALLQVGFFGAFRRSELVNIQREHITFLPEGMDILIPRSKTDPTGEGQSCAIPYGDNGGLGVNRQFFRALPVIPTSTLSTPR